MAKKSSALGRLVECIEIKNADGTVTMVPISSEDNSRANKILASQVRAILQTQMRGYDGKVMTPKELKELAEAAKSVAEFSGEVYKQGDPIEESKDPKKVNGTDKSPDDINFDALIGGQKQSDKSKPEQGPPVKPSVENE